MRGDTSFEVDDTIDDVFLNKCKAGIPGVKLHISQDARNLFGRLKAMDFYGYAADKHPR